MTSYGKPPRLRGFVTGWDCSNDKSHLRSVERENSSQRSNDCCLVILKEIRLDSLYFRGWTISELVEQKRSEFSERAGGLGCVCVPPSCRFAVGPPLGLAL